MPWPAFVCVADRTTLSLSKIFACRGRCSLICTPGTLVLIGLNSPRTSTGAFGLRSYMSMWLGPPASHTRMTDLRFEDELPLAARALSKPGSVRPPKASAPTRRKVRRFREKSSICELLANPGREASGCMWPVANASGSSPTALAGGVRWLVVKHKLACIQNRPQHVFNSALFVLGVLDVIGQSLSFGRGWRTAQRRQVKIVDHIGDGLLLFEELRHAAIAVGDLVFDLLRVRQEENLPQSCASGAFALAHSHAFRTVESIEEVRTEAFVRQVDRPGIRADAVESAAHAAGGVHGVEEHFRGHPASVVAGEVLAVVLVVVGGRCA